MTKIAEWCGQFTGNEQWVVVACPCDSCGHETRVFGPMTREQAEKFEEIPDMGSSGRQGFHLDHINSVKGDYRLKNLQILCWRCNQAKLDMSGLTGATRKAIKSITDEHYAQIWEGIYFGPYWLYEILEESGETCCNSS